MIPVLDPFMAGVKPQGLQRGRGGFLRSADDAPWVTHPSGELVKAGARKGMTVRVKYGSPSNRGREIENDAALVKYRQRLSFLGIGMDTALAEACRDLALMDADSNEFKHAADRIAVEADKLTRSWLAADRGTHGHLICEMVDQAKDWAAIDEMIAKGEAVGIDKPTQLAVSVAWDRMLYDNGLEILAIEASCVDDTWRLAGTLDRIVRTTKPLTFAKPTGELVTIPANTVLILDIKFGKCRKAHPIQIASYAQSVPYDTETEQRGVWPFEIDQTHALIAHGDFGGDGREFGDHARPPSIELVWVDLVAGREHGGQCVVDAKAWAARDDVFSVSQLDIDVDAIEEFGASLPKRVTYDGPWSPVPPVPVAGEVEAAPAFGVPPSPAPSDDCDPHGIARPLWPIADIDELRADPPLTEEEWAPFAEAVGILTPDPARLALVDARAALCANPSEGDDLSGDEFAEQWAALQRHYEDLDDAAKAWLAELIGAAAKRGLTFHARTTKSTRVYELYRALISLGVSGGDSDELLRALMALVVGDVALFPTLEAGHVVGSFGVTEATTLAALVDQFHDGQMISVVDDDGTMRLIAA